MAKFIIEGGKKLSGKVKISGNKNAVFPCLSATLLTSDEVTLRNIPKIADTAVSLEILRSFGVEVTEHEDTIKLKAHKIESHVIPDELAQRLRGSILFVGGLLGRVKKAKFAHPGGDIIGKRTIQPHLDGFEMLGFKIEKDDLDYFIERSDRKVDHVTMFLEEAGVTATENLILAAAKGNTTLILKNCAKEPHIVDLCNLLNKMGAKIEGVGESVLKITGVETLHGTDFTLGSDFLEFGTYVIAAAITHGEVRLTNCNLENLEPVIVPLVKMGIELKLVHPNEVEVVVPPKIHAIPKLHTNIWPGFPTDLMSVFIVLATQSYGVSLLHDWMYESRFFFVDKLISMGANITIADPHRVVVYGPTKLQGRNLDTPDIRAGMALVLAALIADGKSVISKAELIDRGYEDVVGKLTTLGASIEKID